MKNKLKTPGYKPRPVLVQQHLTFFKKKCLLSAFHRVLMVWLMLLTGGQKFLMALESIQTDCRFP